MQRQDCCLVIEERFLQNVFDLNELIRDLKLKQAVPHYLHLKINHHLPQLFLQAQQKHLVIYHQLKQLKILYLQLVMFLRVCKREAQCLSLIHI